MVQRRVRQTLRKAFRQDVMSIIRILPDEVSNRIAAGEVVERPASVVKELVENSLDAGAARIVVETQRGGRSLVHVTDNGHGMDRDDAMLCLEAHATSKVSDTYDIDRISTLGFRGEALPSVAAVSRFQLRTRQADAVAGVEILVDGGALRDVRECGCPVGTSVRVQNLFFNLPARRKFLRTAKTEDSHIQESVLLQALAHPTVAFELTMDNQTVLRVAPGTDVAARVGMLLGRDVLQAMIPVEYEESGIRITGLVARPGMTRSSRREQRMFVNGRPAQSDVLYFALRDAYHTLVMKGRYPPVVLYLEIPPERVDVNVHPTKREVRFRDGRQVGQIAAAAVRQGLRELANAAPVHRLRTHEQRSPRDADPQFHLRPPQEQPHFRNFQARLRPPSDSPVVPAGTSAARRHDQQPCDDDAAQAVDPVPSGARGDVPMAAAQSAAGRGASPSAATREEIRELRVLGVYNSLYLVAEGASGLVLVDQHAAHERILFERLLAAARSRDGTSQPLLLPVTVELSPADAQLLSTNHERFGALGFSFEPFGGNTFLVTGVPAHFPQENIAGMLRDILDDIREGTGAMPRPDEVRIAQAACKHAVRSEDPLTPQEIRRLLNDLAELEMPYTCPHGRPVMINIPEVEVQKRFGRRT